MLVESIMTKNVKTLTLDNTVNDAVEMMTRFSFRHIPIINQDNQLIGIISDRDIKVSLPSSVGNEDPDEILKTTLDKIVRRNVNVCHPLDFVEEIALDFYQYNIGALPVVRNQQLVGIVTQKDMLNTFIELTGMHETGSIIEIDTEDRNGVIYEIGKVFKDLNIKIISVSVYNNKQVDSNKIIVLRIQAMNPLKAIEKLREAGFKCLDPYHH